MNHFAIYLKLTQHCKLILFQLKIILKNLFLRLRGKKHSHIFQVAIEI